MESSIVTSCTLVCSNGGMRASLVPLTSLLIESILLDLPVPF